MPWQHCELAGSHAGDGRDREQPSKLRVTVLKPTGRLIEDNEQNLWLTSSEGVFSIHKSQFNQLIAKEIDILDCKVYGKQQGMAEQECTGATQSLVGSNGSLYIPTLGGLSVFEPSYKLPEMSP